MTTATRDELRAAFLFEAFTDAQLDWLAAHSEAVPFEAGAVVFEEHAPADALWVLLAGELRFTRMVYGREVVLETSSTPGNWGGWLPMFEGAPVTITARVLKPSRVLRVPKETVNTLLDESYPVGSHLLTGIYAGVQNIEAITRQQEKLAALGKLSAGLAHELNNPAAAAGRAAAQLHDALAAQERAALILGGRLDDAGREWLAAFRAGVQARGADAEPLDTLARSDREDELGSWLDDHGIEDGWELAPALVEAGMTAADLDDLAAHLPAEALPDALRWFGASLDLAAHARGIESAMGRITDLVKAVKSYTHMDQAEVQEVALDAEIEDTLKILAYKLRAANVKIVREYDRTLPKVRAHASELNQVWTNLLDNAADALASTEGERCITVRTWREGDDARVEISDNGPGIPPDVQRRIFEPFFTTKPQGEGTGLGLDTARRIVVEGHGGDLTVQSAPGNTTFSVCLPLKPATGGEG